MPPKSHSFRPLWSIRVCERSIVVLTLFSALSVSIAVDPFSHDHR